MQHRETNFGLITRSLLTCLLILIMTLSNTTKAHNKVVVIPMAGEDVEIESEPFAPIPSDYTIPANYTTTNGIVLDTVTGLQWQQVPPVDDYMFHEAVAYCFNLAIDSKTNWRLPTAIELISIVDYRVAGSGTSNATFPATGVYWSTSDAKSLSNFNLRTAINVHSGSSLSGNETASYSVRCVRSNGQNALISVFEPNTDGTVTSLANGLVWQQQDEALELTYDEAINYCEGLVLGDSSNWRLPEMKELTSLLDLRELSPTIDTQLFPQTSSSRYWSTSSYAGFSNSAWTINFGSTFLFQWSKDSDNFVRCVH